MHGMAGKTGKHAITSNNLSSTSRLSGLLPSDSLSALCSHAAHQHQVYEDWLLILDQHSSKPYARGITDDLT